MDISDVDNATLDLAYCGKSSIRNGSQLNIDSKYSNLSLGNVRKMNTEAKYGDIHIDRLDNGYMELKYGNCKIDELKQGITVDELSYSTLTIKDLASNFDKVNVDARYGNLNIYIDVNASFRVVANNMKYGQLQGSMAASVSNVVTRTKTRSVSIAAMTKGTKTTTPSMSTTVKTAVSISKETVIAT